MGHAEDIMEEHCDYNELMVQTSEMVQTAKEEDLDNDKELMVQKSSRNPKVINKNCLAVIQSKFYIYGCE